MMLNVENYIKKPIAERQSHLDLESECVERGGNSTNFKGLLSYYLDVTIPSGYRILLCHKCHNGNCSNPVHMYYGTPKENFKDQQELEGHQTIWEKMIEKYGYEGACRINAKGDKSSGGRGNKGKRKTKKHRENISDSMKRK